MNWWFWATCGFGEHHVTQCKFTLPWLELSKDRGSAGSWKSELLCQTVPETSHGVGSLQARALHAHDLNSCTLQWATRSLLWAVGIMSYSIGLMPLMAALKKLILVLYCVPAAVYICWILHVKATRVDSNLRCGQEVCSCVYVCTGMCVCVIKGRERKSVCGC